MADETAFPILVLMYKKKYCLLVILTCLESSGFF